MTPVLAGVALNPVPVIVTVVPSGPLAGLNPAIANVDAPGRATFVMLPAASYVYSTTFPPAKAFVMPSTVMMVAIQAAALVPMTNSTM